ncbi:hypothetical protein TeGR_g7977 [Tetraparma gracilis]|uniref:Fatty acid desaturase domain-containing protein n=1 Tax=Tetraparma gracilis TaxID=2962635 RepID=A0ABQ6MEM1_9STRA|nr:hypothetical protein TeGR_g7977 [Tetraparma gracilis]
MCNPTKTASALPPTRSFPAGDAKVPENLWLQKFDLRAFKADIKKIGDMLEAQQGPADVAHLRKIILWSNLCFFVGAALMYKVNLVSVVGLSTFTFSRWTMVAHHTCHGGYDKVHPDKGRFNRFKFAVNGFWNRVCDWFDWMMPEAWNVEHNNRHHSSGSSPLRPPHQSSAVDAEAPKIPGKKAIAMEAFARALRQMPTIVADNGGYDSAELVTQLRASHAAGKTNYGLDMYNGCVADMDTLGVRESFKSKLQVLLSASEAAEMILRVDDIIKCAPRQREGQ